MNEGYTIVGLGELLWDLLPTGKQLGGAPANFAYVCRLLGDRGVVASRIGRDELGAEAAARLHDLGLTSDQIQIDGQYPTGTIRVLLDARGEPTYHGTHDAAWDHLESTPCWEALAATADAVCFGSLAQRSAASRAAILQFLDTMPEKSLRLFDVNLRHSFFSAEMLQDSLRRANAIKMNEAEVPRVGELLQIAVSDPQDFARRLIDRFGLRLIAITRGARGSILATSTEIDEHPGIPAHVVDTVGAGDAFGAALVHGYLRSRGLAEIGDFANRVGAWTTTQAGATPTVDGDLRKVVERPT